MIGCSTLAVLNSLKPEPEPDITANAADNLICRNLPDWLAKATSGPRPNSSPRPLPPRAGSAFKLTGDGRGLTVSRGPGPHPFLTRPTNVILESKPLVSAVVPPSPTPQLPLRASHIAFTRQRS